MEKVKDEVIEVRGTIIRPLGKDIGRGIIIERKIFGLITRQIVIYEGDRGYGTTLALFAFSNSWKRRYRKPVRIEEIIGDLRKEKPGWFINALQIIERLLSYQSFSEIRKSIDRVTEISQIDILRIANLLFSRMFINFPRRHKTLTLKEMLYYEE